MRKKHQDADKEEGELSRGYFYSEEARQERKKLKENVLGSFEESLVVKELDPKKRWRVWEKIPKTRTTIISTPNN